MATIAEVLHYAADYCLVHPGNKKGQCIPSCTAVFLACEKLKIGIELEDRIINGLENMGLETGLYNFFEFRSGNDRQGARYAWLKFAALIAEEQGV